MEGQTKLYLNIKTGEISIEGSEEFVSGKMESLEDIISLMQIETGFSSMPAQNRVADPEDSEEIEPEGEEGAVKPGGSLVVPDVFGEWLHMFKDDINGQDKALITAYYVQQDSESNDFKTSQVNKSLKDHGIKLANAAGTLKQIEKKKLIFQTRKVGRLSFKRVSEDGVKHLKSILR